MNTKTCFKCGVEQPRDEFYPHPMMSDGLLGKCKSCTRADVQRNYAAKRDQYQQYERRRRPPKYGPINTRNAGLTIEDREARRKSRIAFRNAVRDKKIEPASKCQRCGSDSDRIEGHHHDYSKPFDVEWLCRPCHFKEHSALSVRRQA